MRGFLKKILDVLFPQSISVEFIEALARNHTLRELPVPPLCPEPWMHALFTYRDPRVRTLVWQIKYQANPFLIEEVGRLLSEEIMAFVSDKQFFDASPWTLVPIPASRNHKREKGFDQTELLCKAIIKVSSDDYLLYKPDGLRKIRDTKAQREIKGKKERKENIHQSLAAADALSGKNIIVIDDVITTGSTLEEARRALLEAGAHDVVAFAIAH